MWFVLGVRCTDLRDCELAFAFCEQLRESCPLVDNLPESPESHTLAVLATDRVRPTVLHRGEFAALDPPPHGALGDAEVNRERLRVHVLCVFLAGRHARQLRTTPDSMTGFGVTMSVTPAPRKFGTCGLFVRLTALLDA